MEKRRNKSKLLKKGRDRVYVIVDMYRKHYCRYICTV